MDDPPSSLLTSLSDLLDVRMVMHGTDERTTDDDPDCLVEHDQCADAEKGSQESSQRTSLRATQFFGRLTVAR